MANVSTLPARQDSAGEIMESVIAKGDLAQLTPDERTIYYREVCKSIGLNPLTRPFDYIMLEGRLTLYCKKDATDQLRKLNGVSIEIIGRDLADDLYTVHVRAKDRHGRDDEDVGAVVMVYPAKVKRRGEWVNHPLAGKPLKGVDRANAIMKAVTKAKRRVTLSISGLGFPDETEVEDVLAGSAEPKPKGESVQPPKAGEKKALPPVVGEATELETVPEDEPEPPEDDRDIILADFKAAVMKWRGNSTRVEQVWRRFEGEFEVFDEDRMRQARKLKAEACLPAKS